jgi:hypothetical protein
LNRDISEGLLSVLRNDESRRIVDIAGGDESLFSSPFHSPLLEEIPRANIITSAQKALVTIFISGTKFLVINVISSGKEFNQNHLLAITRPKLPGKMT